MQTGKKLIIVLTLLAAVTSHATLEILRIDTETGIITPTGVGDYTWYGSPVPTPGVPGQITINTYYNPVATERDNGYDHLALWKTGTLHVACWNNEIMDGPTIRYNTFEVDDIRGANSYTMINSVLMVSNSYWYAWFDVNGDGDLNNISNPVYQNSTNWLGFCEPAAQAEHMPLVVTSETSTASVNFWLIELKGTQPRFVYALDTGDIETIYCRENTVGYNDFVEGFSLNSTRAWIESSWLIQDKYSDTFAGSQSVGGFYGGLDLLGVGSIFLAKLSNYSGDQFGSPDFTHTWKYIGAYTGVAKDVPQVPTNTIFPVCTYPVSAETVTSTTVEFQFTNAWHFYSAVQVDVNEGATNGTDIYDYTGYMENEHYDDGTTRHQAAITGMTAGSNYFYRIRNVWAKTNDATFVPTDWSAWAEFHYTNSP